MDEDGSRRSRCSRASTARSGRALAPRADEVELEQGRAIVREGEWPYEFFAIEEGTAEVRRGDQLLGELGPGDFFGEMALVGDTRRNATRGRHAADQGGRDDRPGVPPDGARAARGGEPRSARDRGARPAPRGGRASRGARRHRSDSSDQPQQSAARGRRTGLRRSALPRSSWSTVLSPDPQRRCRGWTRAPATRREGTNRARPRTREAAW